MNFSICVLLISIFHIAYGDEECVGEHEYVDKMGSCQQCEMCPPGYQPGKYHCGYGSKDIDYKCVACDSGTFSIATDYKLCVTCHPCRIWNRSTAQVCTSTSNARCGSCYTHFFRPLKSDGDFDDECHTCKPNSKKPECLNKENGWMSTGIIVIGVIAILFFILTLIVCVLYIRGRNNRATKPNEDAESNTTRIGSGLIRMLTGRCSHDTITSSSQTPLTTPDSQDIFAEKPRSQVNSPRMNEPSPNTGVHSTAYSCQSTALFCEPNDYSNMPTREFQETARCLRTEVLVHQPGRDFEANLGHEFHQIDGLHSNRADDMFLVESFETNSITKPYSTYESENLSQPLNGEAKVNI
nr:uncharacterized protein LOC100176402 isoform X1 [Ciona intestinalis]|eukprot:XP_026689746.1 uncharacterized protein LOC100176402 isoform X1 [Ciona intestinalis]